MSDSNNAGKLLKNLMLRLTEDDVHPTLVPLIDQWNDDGPTPEQVFSVIDQCAKGEYASEQVLKMLATVYELTLADYNTTHSEVLRKFTA